MPYWVQQQNKVLKNMFVKQNKLLNPAKDVQAQWANNKPKLNRFNKELLKLVNFFFFSFLVKRQATDENTSYSIHQ